MIGKDRTRSLLLVLALAAGLVLSAAPRTKAQDATAGIIGSVADPQGAVIADAKVTATNQATRVAYPTVSRKDGTFELVALPIGTYKVSAEHSGFKTAESPEFTLQINRVQKVDLQMQIGNVSETVEVSAGASIVETVSSTLGQSVTARPLVNLPLNGRNTLDLAGLQPGVMLSNPDDGGNGAGRGFNIAGGRSDSVTYLLDGGNNNNLLNNGVVYVPPPDAVQEFRLLTSNSNAEYGRNGGGIISVVMKSGTNGIHGSAYEFLRNEDLNANTFFNNLNGLPRNILKRNQFGFTLGGPVFIPKVIDGKDKFFWFFSYQGTRQVAATSNTTTTFTPAELAGDFSHSGADGGPDPQVVSFLQANPFFQSNPNLRAQVIIDPNRIDPAAKKYISSNLIPTAPSGTLASQAGGINNADDLSMRFDFNITQRDRLSVTLAAVRNPNTSPFSGQSNVPGYPIEGNNHTYYSTFSYIHTFTNSLLNEARITAQRANRLQAQPAVNLPTPAALGIGVTPDEPTGPSGLIFASGLSTGFSVQGPTTLINNTFLFADNLTWIKGKHNWKFGGSYSPYQNNTKFDFFVDGVFFFDGPAEAGGIGSGNDRADFLFGLPDFYLQFGAAPSDIRAHSTFAFAQDEWHVNRRLTLNLGVRYEYTSPKLDTQGRSFSIIPGQQSQRFINAPTGLVFPGDPGAPKGANFSDRNDWAPRFGFAWDPWGDGKTSIRGGFGIFYDILKGEDNLQYNGQAPFFGFAALFFTPPDSPIGSNVGIFSNPFGNAGITNSFPSRPPAKDINFADAGFLPFGGGGVFFVDPHLRTPYVYQYNLSVQHELTRNLVFEASYVGSDAHKLTSLQDLNPFPLGSTTRVLNAAGTNFSYLLSFENVGNSNYNSLELSLNKVLSTTRFFGTTYFTLAYTLAHSIDNVSGFRNRNSQVPTNDPGLFRASSDFDVRQRLVLSGGWDLPFDRLWKSGPHRLVGGWSLYPIISYNTGFPLDVFANLSASTSSPGPSGVGDRQIVHANLVGGSVTTLDPRLPGNMYFNPSNFNTTLPSGPQVAANPSLATYGTLPRNFFRGPGRTNVDLAVAKKTSIVGERLNMEFRAEFFNLFNSVQFSNPDTTITDGTFGQILTTAPPRIIQFGIRFIF